MPAGSYQAVSSSVIRSAARLAGPLGGVAIGLVALAPASHCTAVGAPAIVKVTALLVVKVKVTGVPCRAVPLGPPDRVQVPPPRTDSV
ncbi:hypothetical protein CKO21_18540 [Rhodovibrio salinarum]|uniref:Uncharacterized protein n=1 Tax=Rhodovibrio salinarum TaxID=1087 RepID=A0A934QN64_9PROT|nr:hypothetical protein [Rhodovibrio salinarum]